jgi:hypothetical protein
VHKGGIKGKRKADVRNKIEKNRETVTRKHHKDKRSR